MKDIDGAVLKDADGESSDIKFIEEVVEIERCDALLVVFSDGTTFSVYENGSCEIIARKAYSEPLPNLIGGQILSLSGNMLINLKKDKPSELYRYVDKKLSLLGHETMAVKSIAQTKTLADGQIHLMKANGDSTLQILESTFTFKSDQEMVLPDQTIITSMDWLVGGEKVVISGTNLPVTVLNFVRTESEKGF